MNASKLGQLLGTTGAIIGLFWAVRHKKSALPVLGIGLAVGAAGLLLGNSIQKFYEQ